MSDTDLQSLSGNLLDSRLRSGQVDAALQQLKTLNPHADMEKLRAGTVLFVPDSPGFKVSAGPSAQKTLLDDLRTLVTGALDNAARNMKSGNATRATERADVTAILKSAAFKRIVGTDKDLAQQADDAQKAMANEKGQDKQAEEALATISKAALAALTQMSKLVG
jgi:hypothetical protein